MDLVYVTSRFPFGPGEAFLGPEISAHLEAGANLRVFPMWAKGGRVHAYVDPLLGRVDGADFGRAAVKSLSGLGTDARSLAQAAAYVPRRSSRTCGHFGPRTSTCTGEERARPWR